MKNWLSCFAPASIARQIKNFSILASGYGQFDSIRKQEALLENGRIVPWYTYPAIEYLESIDFSGKTVFEFGSGNSSLYWASRSKSVTSVEDDMQWHDKVKNHVRENQCLLLRQSEEAYAQAIGETNTVYDVVIIDGNHRPACARASLRHVREDGMIILDNSDWYYKTAALLRQELGFIQVDFYGFGPINAYTWVTSVFLSRHIEIKPKFPRQPVFARGGLKHELHHDEDYL